MTQSGANTILKLTGTDSVTFKNFNINQFSASNFLLRNQISSYTSTFDDEFNTFSVNTGTGSTGNWYQLYPRTGIAAHSTVDHGSIQYFTYAGDTDAFGNPVTVDPFSLNDGVLSITMNPVAPEDQPKYNGFQYTSGMINTIGSFAQTYGYFEIRAKLPAGAGLHDAFWLLPVDGGWPPRARRHGAEGQRPDPRHQRRALDRPGSADLLLQAAHRQHRDDRVPHLRPRLGTRFPDLVRGRRAAVDDADLAGHEQAHVPHRQSRRRRHMVGRSKQHDAVPRHHADPTISAPMPASTRSRRACPVDKMGTDASEELFGTNFNDILNGGLGDDQVYGGAGDDTLTGGGGNVDILDGGFGNDTYLVYSTSDQVQEGLNKGIDTVKTTLSSYTLDNNVENLIYIGTGSHSLLGNGLDNYIQGGDNGGLISGWGGNDTLQGGAGADQLNGGDGNDIVHAGGGADTVRGNDGDDFLYGDDGDDLIKGDGGNDYIEGGAGQRQSPGRRRRRHHLRRRRRGFAGRRHRPRTFWRAARATTPISSTMSAK